MTAVVTGAVGGMGRAVVRRLGRSTDVLVTDIDARALDEFVGSLGSEGISARALPGDISDPAFIDELAAAASGAPLETLVNTAGVWSPAIDAARTFAINYLPTTLLLDAFLPLASPGSVAVCISSTGGHRRGYAEQTDRLLSGNRGARAWPAVLERWGPQIDAHTAYGIAKRGVILECEAHSRAWSEKGARVVSVSPGNFDTPMGALGSKLGGANFLAQAAIGHRPGDPEEFSGISGSSAADVAVFGRIAVGEMTKHGYSRAYAAAVVAAAGAFAALIPPSVTIVIYAVIAEQSVGAMILAAVVPGILSALVLATFVVVTATWRKYRSRDAVAVEAERVLTPGQAAAEAVATAAHVMRASGARRDVERPVALMEVGEGTASIVATPRRSFFREEFGAILIAVILFVIVAGGIYSGLVTATEAGALGALAALIIVAISIRKFKPFAKVVWDSVLDTARSRA